MLTCSTNWDTCQAHLTVTGHCKPREQLMVCSLILEPISRSCTIVYLMFLFNAQHIVIVKIARVLSAFTLANSIVEQYEHVHHSKINELMFYHLKTRRCIS